MNIFNYAFKALDGAPLALERWRGQPFLIVNTASECGYTPQYEKLQRLFEDYRQSGLIVLGIPSNDFGSQEPGSEEDIAKFCSSRFRISFPMTAKYSVLGSVAHPLFIDLMNEFGPDVLPKWNFYKYFFNRAGDLVEHWPSSVEPDDPAVTHVIEQNLHSWVL